MSTIDILHLSDLHWSTKNAPDLKIVSQALFQDLEVLKKEENLTPDLIIFSGDLAQSGDSLDAFQEAYDGFLVPLSKATGIPFEKIFVAPGNHDIEREQVRQIPTLNQSLNDKLTTNAAINSFIDTPIKDGSEKEVALKRVDNFYSAHDSYHPEALTSNHFLRSFKTDVNGCKVGIACLNSAWRATGEPDDLDLRKLIVGERAVDIAISDLEDCDFRIAVHHHPLEWLLPTDKEALEFLARRSFHLSCCGHMHISSPNLSIDSRGSCVTSQTGSVFAGRNWFNGYHFVQVDLPSRNYSFHVREYFNDDRRFGPSTRIKNGKLLLENVIQGDPRRVDQVELFLRAFREKLRKEVAQQINFSDSIDGDDDHVIEHFVTPPVVKRTEQSIDDEDSIPKNYSVDELIAEPGNLVFLADRNAGKTSLAYFLAYKMASKLHTCLTIPVYVDFRDYKNNRYSMKRAISNFYGPIPSGFDLEKAIDDGLFTMLIDNFNADEGLFGTFNTHTEELKNNRWICFATPESEGVSRDRMFNEHLASFEKFHIQELTRGGIRKLSKSWSNHDTARTKEAFDTVMKQIIRDGLPRTPYMVSLLLWSLNQRRNLEKINEATLLSNIIDHLIGKADFRQSKLGVLNPVGKEITLQNLALFFFERSGVAAENETTTFLIEFFSRKKLNFIGGDVLEKLISCGILKRDGDHISFKYPCFQEYFMASLIRNDRKLLEYYLTDLNFLNARREIELLAGLRQQNDDIIEAITNVLTSRASSTILATNLTDFDKIAATELRIGTTKSELNKLRENRLSDEQIDEIMDEADRRAMQRGERPVTESLERASGNVAGAAKERESEGIAVDQKLENQPLKPSTHMAAIDILARVIRNSDFTDYESKGPATKMVLEGWTQIFLVILDEISAILRAPGKKSADPINDEDFSTIMYIMSKFMFSLIGSTVVSQISSPSMADTLHTLIEEGKLSTGELLSVFFLLEDINDPTWQDKWSALIRNNASGGFVIECLVNRLWRITSTKALDDNQATRVKGVISEIEKRLDWSKDQKSNVLENIKKSALQAKISPEMD